MMNRLMRSCSTISPKIMLFALVIGVFSAGCGKKERLELYHHFPDRNWARFNFLSFELPVEKANNYNVSFFANIAPDFPYDILELNMTMTTPSGEERICEYQMPVKNASGSFCIPCSKDSCTGTILLKRELHITRPGILKIELENLTPRLNTNGILGVGIRVEPSGK